MPVNPWEYPQIYSGYWGQQPSGSPSRQAAEVAADTRGVADVPALNAMNLAAWQAALGARIPNARGLEESSSARIAELLNPPAFFPDVDRRSAEAGAMRGVAGSPSAAAVTVKMTDDERLKRLGLGQQFLSGALGRNPPAPIVDPTNFVITPFQREQLNLQRFIAQLNARNRLPTGGYSGGGGGGRGGVTRAGGGTTGAFFDEFFGGGDSYPTTPGFMTTSTREAGGTFPGYTLPAYEPVSGGFQDYSPYMPFPVYEPPVEALPPDWSGEFWG